jgi:hypothetical protein
MKEATSRIKINKLLEAAGWRLFADVAANRELITRFEQKIQASLARIWGEDKAVSTASVPD